MLVVSWNAVLFSLAWCFVVILVSVLGLWVLAPNPPCTAVVASYAKMATQTGLEHVLFVAIAKLLLNSLSCVECCVAMSVSFETVDM